MHSLAALIVLAATFYRLAASQTIDPTSVDIDTRVTWCDNQKASCPLLCLQLPGTTDSTQQNNCTAKTLVYSCVCSNGQSPNVSEYSLTIPYYECTEANNQCANNCDKSDSACQTSCRTAHPCGASNPKRYNATSTTAAAASSTGGSAAETSDGTAVYSGFGSSSTSSSKSDSSSDAQALAIGFGRSYGLVVVLASVFAGFTFLL